MADKNWGADNIILEHYQTKTIDEITDLLNAKSYNITRGFVQKKIRALKTKNTFVSDLAKYSYSDFIEGRIKNCLYASSQLKEILTNAKKDQVRIAAAKTLHRCEVDLATLVSSDILKISATNWAHYVQDLENQIATLKNKDMVLKTA